MTNSKAIQPYLGLAAAQEAFPGHEKIEENQAVLCWSAMQDAVLK